MRKVSEDLTRKVVIALAHTVIQLEIMDEIKETKFYRHGLKRNLNILEKDLENILSGEVGQAYIADENSMRALGEALEHIAKWISKGSFEDILAMGRAMDEDQIQFVHDAPVEEPEECKHEDYKSFQSGFKQCVKCNWIWKD